MARKNVNPGDWGVVRVIAGRLKGRLVFYDDDAENGLAIVYPGVPHASDYDSTLRLATVSDKREWDVRMNELDVHRAWKKHLTEQHGKVSR